jgi:hypothetical protein
LKQATEENRNLLAIIKGFYAFNRAITFLSTKAQIVHDKDLVEVVEYVASQLSSISTPSLKLQLLEGLFAMLFLKESDLANSGQSLDHSFVLRESVVLKQFISSIQALLPPTGTDQVSRLHTLLADVTWKMQIVAELNVSKSKNVSTRLQSGNIMIASKWTD